MSALRSIRKLITFFLLYVYLPNLIIWTIVDFRVSRENSQFLHEKTSPSIAYDPQENGKHNPYRLAFVTKGVRGVVNNAAAIRKHLLPDAVVLYPDSKETPHNIVNRIEEQVKAYGTLDEVLIESHAGSQTLLFDAKKTAKLEHILDGIAAIQHRLGIKVADRIVFASCSLFCNMTNAQVKAYREWAQRYGISLVGTTTTFLKGLSVASFVQFTPDGRVIRDRLSASSLNPILWSMKLLSKILLETSGCINNHAGRTQEEAEKMWSLSNTLLHDINLNAVPVSHNWGTADDNLTHAERPWSPNPWKNDQMGTHFHRPLSYLKPHGLIPVH